MTTRCIMLWGLLLAGCWLVEAGASGQQQIDSLQHLIRTTSQDTIRVNALNTMADRFRYSDSDSAQTLAQKALALAQQADYKRGIGQAYQIIGICYHYRSDFTQALNYYNKSLAVWEKLGNMSDIASILSNIGSAYHSKGDYIQALKFYTKALDMNKATEEGKVTNTLLGNIGLVYAEQGNYPKALEYYFKALNKSKESDNKRHASIWMNAIGIVYRHQGNYDKALDFYFKSLEIKKELGNKRDLSPTFGNIANIYQVKDEYKKAMDYYTRALEIKKELGDRVGVASWQANLGRLYFEIYQQDSGVEHSGYFTVEGQPDLSRSALLDSAINFQQRAYRILKAIGAKAKLTHSMLNLGNILFAQQRYEQALAYYHDVYDLADSLKIVPQEQAGAHGLYKVYKVLGSPGEALRWHERYTMHKDSVFNEEKQKEFGRQEAKYEWQQKLLKKEKEQEKQQALARERAQRQRIIIGSVSGGLLLVLVFAGFLYNRFRVTKKQKTIIEAQKEKVDQKNKEITDSISYAQRIQQAVLVPESEIKQSLPNSFSLLKPQSIVSGDFYYFAEVRGHIIISAIDCTGHGVPGAFMSLIGNDLLNQIVYEQHLTSPAEVLNELDNQLEQALRQETDLKRDLELDEQEFVRDGMDLAFCVLHPAKNVKEGKVTLQYAGANNPLYVVSGSRLKVEGSKIKTFQPDNLQPSNLQLFELPPDKQPIGKRAEKEPFTDKSVELNNGDTFYVFSDGYPDQFGGPKGKKFMYKRFRELLLDIQDKPMDEQKKILDQTIEDWMAQNEEEQIDDVCVMGVRIA